MDNFNQNAPKSKQNLQTDSESAQKVQFANSYAAVLLKQAVNVAVDYFLMRRSADKNFKRRADEENPNPERVKPSFKKPQLEGIAQNIVKDVKNHFYILQAQSKQNDVKVKIDLNDFADIESYSRHSTAQIEAAFFFIFTKLFENLPKILAGKTTQITLTRREFCADCGISQTRRTPALYLLARALANAKLEITTAACKKGADPQYAKGFLFAKCEKIGGNLTLNVEPENAKVLRLLLQHKITAPAAVYDLTPRQARIFWALARICRRNSGRLHLQKIGVKQLLSELGDLRTRLTNNHAGRAISRLTVDIFKVCELLPIFNVVFFETTTQTVKTTTQTLLNGVKQKVKQTVEKAIPPARLVKNAVVLFSLCEPAPTGDFEKVFRLFKKPTPPPYVAESLPEPTPAEPKRRRILNIVEATFERLERLFRGDLQNANVCG